MPKTKRKGRKRTAPVRPLWLTKVAVTAAEDEAAYLKAENHGVTIAELIRRAIAAYPARPSVQS